MATTRKNNKFLQFSFDFELLDACPLCESTVMIPNGSVSWIDMDFWYVICASCGVKFMNPRPTQKSYRKFFKELYWEQKIRNVSFHQPGQMWGMKRYKWDNSKIWKPDEGKKIHIDKHRTLRVDGIMKTLVDNIKLDSNADILEVGPGFGVTLDEIRKKYRSKVYAIELSGEAQKTLKELKIPLLGEYMEDVEKVSRTKQKFDAVIFSHVLASAADPVQVIRWTKKCLKKNGIIYIQCSHLYTFDQMNPYHTFIFSKHTLGLLAKKVGLMAKRVDDDPKHRMLSMVLL